MNTRPIILAPTLHSQRSAKNVTSFIYLDNNATTQIAPEVLDAMLPYLRQAYGNPASTQYAMGREASRAVEKARAQAAGKLNAGESDDEEGKGSYENQV